MSKGTGWLAIGGIFSLFAAAEAQTPAPSMATTAFDGTYTLVSSTPGNAGPRYDPYLKGVVQCREVVRPGPLTIERGQARLSNDATSNQFAPTEFAGTVGPQGELVMRIAGPAAAWPEGVMPGNEINLGVRIDRNGTARGRAVSRACVYDLMRQMAR